MSTDQTDRLHRALIALSLLRAEPLRSEEIARRLDDRPGRPW
jgi:hypothetical protein